MAVNKKWINRFYDLATHISEWSNDKHSKVGAVIVNKDRRVLSMGYNGLPSGTNDTIEKRFERPTKYKYMVHAEANAIINAARLGNSINEGIMFCTYFPCVSCAQAIINSGISAIYTPEPNVSDKYKEDVAISLSLFTEANINVNYIQ